MGSLEHFQDSGTILSKAKISACGLIRMSVQARHRKSGRPTLIIDSALDTGHEVAPSALTHSISEEVEIRNLGWVSHLLFNHRDPQMQ